MARTVTITIAVPDWARWIARDQDGTWRVFAGRPNAGGKWWDENGYHSAIVAHGFHQSNDWKSTLRKL